MTPIALKQGCHGYTVSPTSLYQGCHGYIVTPIALKQSCHGYTVNPTSLYQSCHGYTVTPIALKQGCHGHIGKLISLTHIRLSRLYTVNPKSLQKAVMGIQHTQNHRKLDPPTTKYTLNDKDIYSRIFESYTVEPLYYKPPN